MNPQLEQVAEEGGGMFMRLRGLQSMRESNIPESCLRAASSKAALCPLWSPDYPPPAMSSLHVTTSVFKDRCPGSQSQAEVEISKKW